MCCQTVNSLWGIKIQYQMQVAIRCRKNQVSHNKENCNNNQQQRKRQNQLKEAHPILTHLPSSPDDQLTPIQPHQSNSPLRQSCIIQLLEYEKEYVKEKSNSTAYLQLFGEEIWRESLKQVELGNFLVGHNIDVSLRGRMLDWMTEVTCSYKFDVKSYFDGVLYLDKYLKAKEKTVEPYELHCLGIASMLLSSKQNEVCPLNIDTVYQRIGHKKIDISSIANCEADILKTLDYRLNQWSFYDIAATYLNGIENPLYLSVLEYISRLIVIEYRFYSNIKPAFLGAAAAWVTLSICKQEDKIDWNLCKADIVAVGRKIIGLVSGFRSVYPNFKNADRFTDYEVIKAVYNFADEYSIDMI